MFEYWLGVFLAILSGIANNLGTVLQKKVVNEVGTSKEKFFRSLVKKPVWLLGLVLQLVVGTIFFMIAQVYIGPTLIPGLMAAGLIFLAIGSVKIVGEDLKKSEIFGIALMIGGIAFIGFSNLSIDLAAQNYADFGLILRITIFTVFIFALSGLCKIFEKKDKFPGISLAILSGFMFALSNFWIGPLMGVIVRVIELTAFIQELIIFIAAGAILTLTNIIGLATIQQSMQKGQASNMIPIQQVPIQIAPVFYFVLIFFLPITNIFSLMFIILGIGLVIVSSFLLGKRQSEIEKIE